MALEENTGMFYAMQSLRQLLIEDAMHKSFRAIARKTGTQTCEIKSIVTRSGGGVRTQSISRIAKSYLGEKSLLRAINRSFKQIGSPKKIMIAADGIRVCGEED